MRGTLKLVSIACLTGAVAIVGLAAQAPAPDLAPPSDVVGRWCDPPAGEIIIRRTAAGLVASMDVAKGHPPWQRAVDREGQVFRVRDSANGDGYRILSNGDLELIDRDGPIRTARKATGACTQ